MSMNRDRLHELELQMVRAMGSRPNYSRDELESMRSDIRDEVLHFPVHQPVRRGGVNRRQANDVYRFYDVDGVLLYVGLSMHLPDRLSQHRQSSLWLSVSRIEVEHLADRDSASARERELISTLHPLHNRNGGGA